MTIFIMADRREDTEVKGKNTLPEIKEKYQMEVMPPPKRLI